MSLRSIGDPCRPAALLRVCLHSVLMLGIVGMHGLHVGTAAAPPVHHISIVGEMPSEHEVSSPRVVGGTAMDAVAAKHHGGTGPAEDCCGVLMLCLAMVAGLGSLILMWWRRVGRVLWQLPPPFSFRDLPRPHPLLDFTPLQRSCILRC